MNTIGGNDAMAYKFIENLKTRTISALIMIPFLILAVYLMGVDLVLLALALCLTFEIGKASLRKKMPQKMAALSLLVLVYSSILSLWLIGYSKDGVFKIMTLFIIICSSDIFAYIGGSLLKGPKLYTKLSPSKTYSGAITGIVMPVAIYYLLKQSDWDLIYPDLLLHQVFILAFLAELGDLLESTFKRIMGIKDFSNLIPGHGGVMDRYDSAVLSSIYFYLIL